MQFVFFYYDALKNLFIQKMKSKQFTVMHLIGLMLQIAGGSQKLIFQGGVFKIKAPQTLRAQYKYTQMQ